MASSSVHYRIAEIAQHLLGQLDASILKYYRKRWPTQLDDFVPVTCRDPHPQHSPLQMIVDSYTVVKEHYKDKQDADILSAIILFYYSTVILEYYVLNEAEHYKVCLQKKYISEDGSLLVTQDNQLFYVPDIPATNGLIELHKVKVGVTSTSSLPPFQTMEEEQRKETLRTLSRELLLLLQSQEESHPPPPPLQRFFLRINDPYGFILTPKDDRCNTFYKTQSTVEGFFHRFQNKEINSLLFQITSREDTWARQLRRRFHGMEEETKDGGRGEGEGR